MTVGEVVYNLCQKTYDAFVKSTAAKTKWSAEKKVAKHKELVALLTNQAEAEAEAEEQRGAQDNEMEVEEEEVELQQEMEEDEEEIDDDDNNRNHDDHADDADAYADDADAYADDADAVATLKAELKKTYTRSRRRRKQRDAALELVTVGASLPLSLAFPSLALSPFRAPPR